MWLYVPSNCSQAQEGSPSGSSLSEFARCVSWRGKLSQPRVWSRRWRKDAWLKRLSGVMLSPLMADRGVDEWRSLLEGSHARTCPPQGRGQESRSGQGVGSGSSMPESSQRSLPGMYSSRTSGRLSGAGLTLSSPTLPRWGTMRNGVVSEHPTLGPRTAANGYSFWPTPTANEDKFRLQGDSQQSKGLEAMGRLWATATVTDAAGRNYCYSSGDKQKPVATLTGQAIGTPFSSPLVQTTPQDGLTISKATHRLNPLFVEALMGWPVGWTGLEPSETESSRSKQPSPGESCTAA